MLALPRRFSEATFAFQSRYLTGAKEDLPRWKKCVAATDAALGEALAVPFVQRTFGEDGKRTTKAMVEAIAQAFEANLDGLGWMDAGTQGPGPIQGQASCSRRSATRTGGGRYDELVTDRRSFLGNLTAGGRARDGRETSGRSASRWTGPSGG